MFDVLRVIGRYLRVWWDAFNNVISFSLGGATLEIPSQFRWAVPLGIALAGGISVMIGHSVILAINRVGRYRHVLTLICSGLLGILTAAVETLIIWLLASPFVDRDLSLAELAPLVFLSFAPYVFGFLISLPYTGPGIAAILQVWHMVALWAVLHNFFAGSAWLALLLAFASTLVISGIDHIVNNSRLRLRERFFRFVSNTSWIQTSDLMRIGSPEEQS